MENKRDSSIPKVQSAKTPPVPDKAKNGGPDRLQRQIRILYVEDNHMVARTVKRSALKLVEPENLMYLESAEEALAILEKDSNFDLILLDLRMPGMGGVKMILQLADEGKTDILDKIMPLSGTAFDLIENERAFAAVKKRFLEKPGDPDDVPVLLQRVIDEKEITGWVSPCEIKRNMKVLIVDDEPTLGNGMARLIRTAGVEKDNIVYVLSAEEALEKIEKQDFDLIISDVEMPGIGGCGFVSALKSQGKQDVIDRIILNTSNVESVSKLAFKEVKGRVFEKPLDPWFFESLIQFMGRERTVEEWAQPRRIVERE